MDSLGRQVARIREYRPAGRDWTPVVDAPDIQERRLTVCTAPAVPGPVGSLEDARQFIRRQIIDYLKTYDPGYILLIKALPGVGKTTTAVSIAESLATMGKRVAYAGPRHDFFDDIQDKAAMPAYWYEWLPRQFGNPEDPRDPDNPQTCLHNESMLTWLNRGYSAMDFCSGVCGWDYVNKKCVYHKQKATGKPILYLQHQHVSLGHPLADKFDVLIGDESPINAFCRTWQIPERWICPPGMSHEEPLTEILYTLQHIAANLSEKSSIQGPDLLEMLGGAQAVFEACQTYNFPIDSRAYGSIHEPDDASNVPYFHLPALSNLLERESAAHLAGKKYPTRVIVSQRQLTLLLRHKAQLLPSHVIWLDATGRQDLYEQIFERPVQAVDARPKLQGRIVQIVDRSNGKQALTGIKIDDPITDHARQAETVIRAIIQDNNYQRPSVIGFKKYIDNCGLDLVKKGHFYAARGTNSHEDADAIFILGAPQASPFEIVRMAKQIYFDSDDAFNVTWSSRPIPYIYLAPDGQGRAYPAGGFWHDARLQAILESIREDEIIQAAHRGRPVNHPVDIYLFTNVPIAGLPPDDLMTMRELLGVEPGVNIWQWRQFIEFVDTNGRASVKDLESGLRIHHATAREYIHRLGAQDGYHIDKLTAGRGRPQIVIVRDDFLDDI